MASITYKKNGFIYKVNHDAFCKTTPESSYWIGQMLSDGNIFENRIKLCFSIKDLSHLEKFKEFLESTHPIRIYPSKNNIKKNGEVIKSNAYAVINIRSDKICYCLNKFGVTPKKSLTAKIIGLENNRDFWRGVIDGDGSICNVNRRGIFRPTISLVGSEKIINQFLDFCEPYLVTKKSHALKQRNKNIYQTQITGKGALKIIEIIYDNPKIALKRKYEKAMEIIKYHGHP